MSKEEEHVKKLLEMVKTDPNGAALTMLMLNFEKEDLEAKLALTELQVLEMKNLIARLQSDYSGVPIE